MTNFITTEAVAPAPEGPRKPTHKVRNAVLIGVGVTVALVIGITVGNSGSHPAASQAPAPPATSAPAQPAGYAQIQDLLTNLAKHGAPCRPIDAITASQMSPGVLAAVDCTGLSSGDSLVAVFRDHASAAAWGMAAIVGDKWAINTTSAYAAKVHHAIGGQLVNQAAPSTAPATSQPAPTSSIPAQPASPAITASQQQAVDAAQGYLDLGSGFSHDSLIKQLTSQYGNGFSTADAEFAVSYLHPDWNAQAVDAAKGYMNLGTGFSRASLIQQLTSPYGNGFTEAQAEYAASQVGL
jgi:hypothetical protein